MTLFSVKQNEDITMIFFFHFLRVDNVDAKVHARHFLEKNSYWNIFFFWFEIFKKIAPFLAIF